MKFNIGHKNVRQILLAIINQNSLQYPLEARRIVWSRIM